MFTLNQVVTLILLLMMLIGLHLGLHALVRGGHHLQFLSEYLVVLGTTNYNYSMHDHHISMQISSYSLNTIACT